MIYKTIRRILRFLKPDELEKSNWGRNFGWDIEYREEIIGELVHYEFIDTFWDSYIIRSVDREMDEVLTDRELWNQCVFRFRNKRFNTYAQNVFSSSPEELAINKRIFMRGLYLTD